MTDASGGFDQGVGAIVTEALPASISCRSVSRSSRFSFLYIPLSLCPTTRHRGSRTIPGRSLRSRHHVAAAITSSFWSQCSAKVLSEPDGRATIKSKTRPVRELLTCVIDNSPRPIDADAVGFELLQHTCDVCAQSLPSAPVSVPTPPPPMTAGSVRLNPPRRPKGLKSRSPEMGRCAPSMLTFIAVETTFSWGRASFRKIPGDAQNLVGPDEVRNAAPTASTVRQNSAPRTASSASRIRA